MLDSEQPHSPLFEPLVQAFFAKAGHEVSSSTDCVGFEIETSTALVRIAPHPLRPATGMIEILLSDLPEATFSTLYILHRLNHDALLSHEWVASLGDDDSLVLTAFFRLGETDAVQLDELVADGLERATHLRELWSVTPEEPLAPQSFPPTDFRSVNHA